MAITRQTKRIQQSRVKYMKFIIKYQSKLITLFELYEENIRMQKIIDEEKLVGTSNILWVEFLTDGLYLEKTSMVQKQMNWLNQLEIDLLIYENYDFITVFINWFSWEDELYNMNLTEEFIEIQAERNNEIKHHYKINSHLDKN